VLKQSVSALLALAAACSLLAAAPAGAPASRPSSAFEIGKLQRNLETGTGKLAVTVPGPGDLFLFGAGVLPILREPAGEQTVNLPVIAFGAAKRHLLRRGFVTLTAKITFTPTGGSARTRVKKLTLKAALGR
jgi:hypothetical protein